MEETEEIDVQVEEAEAAEEDEVEGEAVTITEIAVPQTMHISNGVSRLSIAIHTVHATTLLVNARKKLLDTTMRLHSRIALEVQMLFVNDGGRQN